MATSTHRSEKPETEEENDVAEPGFGQNISFERPGLVGGTYAIQVQQTISKDMLEKEEPKNDSQHFEVVAPRFDLPTDSVHSIYPEQGHEATHDTLPHIVLNDSTLPWERTGSDQAKGHCTDDYSKHAVPWMALLIFSPDELRLNDVEKAGIFAHTSLNAHPPKQSESMAVRVPLGDLVKLKEGTASVPFDDQVDLDQAATEPSTNMIFPKASLFNRLFAAYDDNGQPQPGTPDISRHRLLAHVVRMNTRGTDSDKVDTSREFSVVIANRIGPLDGDKASEMIVHFVSLEGVESLNPLPLPEVVPGSSSPEQPARVGLVSLHSWSYTCLPPNSLNVKQTFENLARTASMLKPIIPPHSEHLDDAGKRMLNRFEEGYTIVRSRTPTGEPTPALIRGPLTPNFVAPLERDFLSSNSGVDLRIFDEKLDMMDITYSSAWSLGRSLALANEGFTVSLTRVRHEILHPGTSERGGGWKTTTYDDDDLTDPSSSSSDWSIILRFVSDLYHLVNVPSRYLLPGQSMLPRESLRFFFVDGNWIDALVDGALSLGYLYQGSLEGSPVEDGHVVRRALKTSIDRFMFTIDDPTTVHHHHHHRSSAAAVPRYGFFLRSSVIAAAQFPDLIKVSVVEQPSGGDHPNLKLLLLRHDIVAEETMLGFFSEAPPVEGELYQMRFEVPAHQQFFSLGSVTDQDLEVVYKRQYTTTKPEVEDGSRNVPAAIIKWPRDGKGKSMSTNGNDTRERSQVFIWGSKPGLNDVRLVLVEKLAADVHATLVKEMAELGSDWYEETTATSAMMAYQLSSRSWHLQIG
ncbi:hypothetical protein GE21DRAFT_3694 [Neurospora crassa]|uniref:Uncharacterized protein n=1 Tax=Neurospora crassa (strain ATCC 24698 / 74-OR23-1A / CBS 708.71 / DSM 1257 / FGSC 987) TaxID=367110 RepID=V5IR84_NEUCR|nr:hypothetical protein NCU09354 [Neurospora crassa OR74A]XP_011393635.1 uncharacterized protein NCU09354 [Neurospora crassa OR74A]ESA43726.1 hypothetical protein NCU09354 [Neurospora crassa OR74A]ESA43727.1 hypothetical protein, variant [Neurospora crassa OR74A]KHE87248.1 hypothetical protein GE21DRAFT_3694 [Neurospora crassa]|eukprot:XP_011393634.1 hypothetical protein NCU09354 [Neurospora crassa OR74A]